MAGLDNNMLSVIECLAKNKIQDAKNAAIVCCKNDTTKKNAANLNYYQKLLENGNSTFMELPPNLQAYMSLEDVSGFREDRYYVGEKQQKLYDQILVGTKVSDRLMEYGISYHNSTLLYGVPGTGKTEFARYVAYKLGLPYAYLNFSNLIDSYMGKTLGEKMYDAFMFLAIIALIACLCFADKPHTDTITEKRETVTVQDKFSELDTSEMVLIQFADTEYYLTVSRKNDTDLHDVEVSKRQYHSIGKGSKVKCIVTYRNGKVDDIEIDED